MGRRMRSSLKIISSTAASAGSATVRATSCHSPAVPPASARAFPSSLRSARASSSLPHMTVEGPVIPCRSRKEKRRFSFLW